MHSSPQEVTSACSEFFLPETQCQHLITHKECKLRLCQIVCGHLSLSRLTVSSLHAKTNQSTNVSIGGVKTCLCVCVSFLEAAGIWRWYVSVFCVCVLTVEVDNVIVELVGEQRLWQFSEEHL